MSACPRPARAIGPGDGELVARLGELSLDSGAGDGPGRRLRDAVAQRHRPATLRQGSGDDLRPVLDLFGGTTPPPRAARGRPAALRDVGLSWRKVDTCATSPHVVSGELELDRLDQLTDEEVIAEITAVRGSASGAPRCS